MHSIPLNSDSIDSQARKLVRALQNKKYTTYLVGGCVRDLLLNLPPKDWDIATSALPEEVNKVIRPSHIIGRRFKLVLVKRYGRQYEISTFRAQAANTEENEEGPITDDNTFGNPEEDAKRRDFTINSFFYDPMKEELLDYTDGLKDIESRVVRMIGEPKVRIQEDPLRMLRAIRFAYKANFQLEPTLRAAILDHADLLHQSVLPRRREELLKFLRLPTACNILWECHDLGLLDQLCPTLDRLLGEQNADIFHTLLNQGLGAVSDSDSPNELFSVFLFAMIAAKVPNFSDHLKLDKRKVESLSVMMKNELGMYRVEQDTFFQTLTLLQKLKDIPEPRGIRSRYRTHLVKNNSMPVALTLAKAFQLIPDSHTYYWTQEFWNASN